MTLKTQRRRRSGSRIKKERKTIGAEEGTILAVAIAL